MECQLTYIPFLYYTLILMFCPYHYSDLQTACAGWELAFLLCTSFFLLYLASFFFFPEIISQNQVCWYYRLAAECKIPLHDAFLVNYMFSCKYIKILSFTLKRNLSLHWSSVNITAGRGQQL